jgi:hypothetical protein
VLERAHAIAKAIHPNPWIFVTEGEAAAWITEPA